MEGDPGKALFYKDTPQASKRRDAPERHLKYLLKEQVGKMVDVIYIPVAYAPRSGTSI